MSVSGEVVVVVGVENFVMSVIEAASCSSCPTSPSPVNNGDEGNKGVAFNHSFELVDKSLGSLSLTSLTTERLAGGGSGGRSGGSHGSRSRRESKEGKQKNGLLARQKSPIKALTPEDLGLLTVTSPTVGGEGSASGEGGDLLTAEHLSQEHLRKPLQDYAQHQMEENQEGGPGNLAKPGGGELEHEGTQEKDGGADEVAEDVNQTVSSAAPLSSEAEDKEDLTNLDEPPGVEEKVHDNNEEGNKNVHHFHHHHHHYNHVTPMEPLSHQFHQSFPFEFVIPERDPHRLHPLPPLPPHDLEELAFYRKFSATSPIQQHYHRSKSSMAWAAPTSDLHTSAFPSSMLCSSSKKHKSRSTPVRLDSLGSPPAQQSPYESQLPSFECPCGGCQYCCNELACNCCCDDCCCARQTSHMVATHPASSDSRIHSKLGSGHNHFHQHHRSHSLESIPHHDVEEEHVEDNRFAFLDDDYDTSDSEVNEVRLLNNDHITSPPPPSGFESTKQTTGEQANATHTTTTTSIVIIRKKQPATSTPNPRRHHHHRSHHGHGSSRTNNVVRVANGGIHSSSATASQVALTTETTKGQEEGQKHRSSSATMMLTVDTMSLFLDAVHVRMNRSSE